MIARSLLQAFVVLVSIGMAANHAVAEQRGSDSQAAEINHESTSGTDPATPPPSSQPQPDVAGIDAADAADDLADADIDDGAAEPFFAEGSDPLFDDDYELEPKEGYLDPFEEPNRAIFIFNQGLDYFLLGPITGFFGYVTPDPVKRGLRNFFDNINWPVVFANDLMQLEWTDAAVVTGAFVVNTTVGIVGFFEPAKHIGLRRHDSDFGQTLALARVPSGPYLILPIAGPSTARDTVGSIFDFFLRPNTWLFPLSNFYYYGGEGVVTLEKHREALQELERSSVDFYSVMHSAYYQIRNDQIWGRRQDRRPSETD